ncbi:unnamed protein product [Arabidopsis halleri]
MRRFSSNFSYHCDIWHSLFVTCVLLQCINVCFNLFKIFSFESLCLQFNSKKYISLILLVHLTCI